ncbi:energy transducer TonB [Sphingomonas sp. Leaf33]|uniref:energy transducer TonB n=1 Tax=Sphingomonas sp. Leaf33 TaxID=1736215 RepID=UPI000A5A7416|nr:TonB family protein [Sphingomonas sp. Leaf33]
MPILTMLTVVATAHPQVPPAPPIPPVVSGSTRAIFEFMPGTATCDGGTPAPVAVARPIPSAGVMTPGQAIAPYRFRFRIADDGRVLGVVPETRVGSGPYVPTPDLQPALAASRFATGAPQARCTIEYDVQARPIADAPAELVRRYLTLPHDAAYFEGEMRKRAQDADGDCYDGRGLAPLLRAYPDLDAVPQAAGTLSMTVAGFDLDRNGKPVRVRTVQSDGNAALDAATRQAAAKSRFKTDRARTGCVLPMMRRQRDPLEAPESPSLDGFRTAGDGCPLEAAPWANLPRMTFPEPFRRRGIEGWAIMRYDVAPWGQVGNVSVIASEPAAAFGDQARQILSSARRAPSTRGASGCVERVRFKLPEGDEDMRTPPPPPPPPIID